jgi:hypothetical protein
MTARLFNGPVEVGLRSLVLLVAVFPEGLDLQRLVTLDYLLIHSGDVRGGPQSLHPPSPLRAGEVAVRRGLIEDGLRLYRARGLVVKQLSPDGIRYTADDSAASFLDALSAPYVAALRDRADWVTRTVGQLDSAALGDVLSETTSRWRAEFAVFESEGESE